jgi:hypothetical protein
MEARMGVVDKELRAWRTVRIITIVIVVVKAIFKQVPK